MASPAIRLFLYKKNLTTPRLKIKYNTRNKGEPGKEKNGRERREK